VKREIVVVPDATLDRRFARNPFVAAGPRYRFYAGAPLVTPDNRALGTLCVIDTVIRTLSAAERADLQALSRLAMTELELRRSLLREGAVKKARLS
jgi:GAF domain-containing protein